MMRHDVNEHATAETRRKGALASAEAKRQRREQRRSRLDAAADKLAESAAEAAETVSRLLAADSEAVRLRAALGVLQLLGEYEMTELAERLADLEREIAGGT